MATSRRNDPEKHRKANREYAKRVRSSNPEKMLWAQAKGRAKHRGIPFDIEVSDVVIPAHCPVLGIPLRQEFTRQIDRVIPSLGYVKGNVAVVSHLANIIKSCGDADQHRMVSDWLNSLAPHDRDEGL